jgi:hypothetical protein
MAAVAPVTAPPPKGVLATIGQRVEPLRRRDNLIAGTMITGMLAITTVASWLYGGPTGKNLASAVVTAGLAKFFGGADGALKVFTDYFPKALLLNRSLFKPDPASGPTGSWLGTGIDVRWSQFHDPRLAAEMTKLLTERKMKDVWNFGCGSDEHSKVFTKAGITSNGLDGNPETVALSGGTAMVQDLAVPFEKEARDCVISIEVGAKIRPEYEDQFFANINKHAKHMAIISWPVPGQKGPNQHNRQTNEHVIGKMDALGWKLDVPATWVLRDQSHPIYYWTQDTMMVFIRKAE